MRHSRAGTRMRALWLQDNWPWCGSRRQFLLLCSLRTRGRCDRSARPGLIGCSAVRGCSLQAIIRIRMGLKRHKELASGRRYLRNHSASRSSSLKCIKFRWANAISASEWKTYRSAIRALRNEGIEFLLGGGFARAAFTGHWRDTKDVDLYVRPEDRGRAECALTKAGFADYYDKLPYDRAWIYRSYKRNVIVDIIWAMANQRAKVDAAWFQHAPQLTIRG